MVKYWHYRAYNNNTLSEEGYIKSDESFETIATKLQNSGFQAVSIRETTLEIYNTNVRISRLKNRISKKDKTKTQQAQQREKPKENFIIKLLKVIFGS